MDGHHTFVQLPSSPVFAAASETGSRKVYSTRC